jgi:hypothetical protein
MRGSVMVVFAEQTAIAGAVLAAFGSMLQMMHIAVDRLLVTSGPPAVLITGRDSAEQCVGDRRRQHLVTADGAVFVEHEPQ